jgi:hypothetical protein
MNGIQLEQVLNLIDSNIQVNMESVRAEVLDYLTKHRDDLAHQISEKGCAVIPTQIGDVTVSRKDLEPVHV